MATDIIVLPPAPSAGILSHEDVRVKINEHIARTNAHDATLTSHDSRLIVLEGSDANAFNKVVILDSPESFNITFQSDVIYYLETNIDLTGTGYNIAVPSGGLKIRGHTAAFCSITCADAGYTLFTGGAVGSVSITGITISVTDATSKVYDLTGTALAVFTTTSVVYSNCLNRGKLSGFYIGQEETSILSGGTPVLELDGTWSSIFNSKETLFIGIDPAYTGTLFKAGPTFLATNYILNLGVDLPAGASLTDVGASNFPINESFVLNRCSITRADVYNAQDTNITPNISYSDLKCQWTGNRGVPNTNEHATVDITGEVASLTTTPDTYVLLAGTSTLDDAVHFSSPADMQLQSDGITPRDYIVMATLDISGTATDVISVQLRKYSAATTSETVLHTLPRVINNVQGGLNFAFFNMNHPVLLDTGDIIRVYVASADGNACTAAAQSRLSVYKY